MLFLCHGSAGFCQFKVRFSLKLTGDHSADSVFVAGSFNDWKPNLNGDSLLRLKAGGIIELDSIAAGVYQFKFTRGGWPTVECNARGADIKNRTARISSDTLIRVSIAGWKDDFAPLASHHTASANVRVIDTAFNMPQLNRKRRIWLYLPPGYRHSRKRYPVLYMQDGQNLFDAATSSFGEWGVDECVDTMVRNGSPACIIVGIDNGPQRLTEYNPCDFKEAGKGEGDAYLAFLVETLKPFIDKRYRTLRDSRNTIIAGSSMGGLISYYAMLKYPGVFGKAGVFSPAFWTADKIGELTDSLSAQVKGALFFYAGEKEGERFTKDMQEVTDKLGGNSSALIYSVTDPLGEHNEQAWRKWFPEFYAWILSGGFNNVIDTEKELPAQPIP